MRISESVTVKPQGRVVAVERDSKNNIYVTITGNYPLTSETLSPCDVGLSPMGFGLRSIHELQFSRVGATAADIAIARQNILTMSTRCQEAGKT